MGSSRPACRGAGLAWRPNLEPAVVPAATTSDVLAAVYVQLGAVHVARLVGAQEIDGLGHLLGLAQAPQRDLLVHYSVRARRQDGGVDLARRDGVDADAA